MTGEDTPADREIWRAAGEHRSRGRLRGNKKVGAATFGKDRGAQWGGARGGEEAQTTGLTSNTDPAGKRLTASKL